MRSSTRRTGRRKVRAVLAIMALSVLAVHAAAGQQAATGDPIASGWEARQLQDAASPGDVQNNLVDGAMAGRDKAESDWRNAVSRYQQTLGQAQTASATAGTRAPSQAAAQRPDPLAK